MRERERERERESEINPGIKFASIEREKDRERETVKERGYIELG